MTSALHIPLVALFLAGCGLAREEALGQLEVTPLALGDVRIGAKTEVTLQLHNVGRGPLGIYSATLVDEAGTPLSIDGSGLFDAVDSAPVLPVTIAGGGSVFVRTTLVAREREAIEARLLVKTDETLRPEVSVPITACGRAVAQDAGPCGAPPAIRKPAFVGDDRVTAYYDFVAWPNRDFKAEAHLEIDGERLVENRGLALSGLGKHGAKVAYSAGNTVIARLRRDFDVETTAGGMLFGTTSRQNDDGISIFGDRLGARTYNTNFRIIGTALTNVLPARGEARSIAMVLDPAGATFLTSGVRYEPQDLGPGASYDALNVEGLWLGTNGAEELDAWNSGPIFLERLVVFNARIGDSETFKFVTALDQL